MWMKPRVRAENELGGFAQKLFKYLRTVCAEIYPIVLIGSHEKIET